MRSYAGARARENMQAELYKVDGSNRLDASVYDAGENASARAAALGTQWGLLAGLAFVSGLMIYSGHRPRVATPRFPEHAMFRCTITSPLIFLVSLPLFFSPGGFCALVAAVKYYRARRFGLRAGSCGVTDASSRSSAGGF